MTRRPSLSDAVRARVFALLLVSTLALFAGCGPFPFGGGGGSSAPKSTSPQWCFASFAQPATARINETAPTQQTLLVPQDCVPQNLGLDKSIVQHPDPSRGTLTVTLQPIHDIATLRLKPPDTLVNANCSGATAVQQVFQVLKSPQSGVLVANDYYPRAPTAFQDDSDLIAAAIFSAYTQEIGAFLPTTYSGLSVIAQPRTTVTKNLYWTETFKRAIASVSVSGASGAGGTVISGVTVAIPTGVAVDDAQTNASQPSVTACG